MVTPVPFNDLRRIHDPIRAELVRAVSDVIESDHYIGGPSLDAFEKAFASLCEVEHAVGVSSGTDALIAALMAEGIGAGDEVVTTPFTFFATAGAIHRVGATPVFADIDPVTFNIAPESVSAVLTPRTRAIVAVHLFGQSADMVSLAEVAAGAGVSVIEDAAQSVGARDEHDRMVGSIGTMGCFSFFPAKNLGGLGDGGAVTTHDGEVATLLRSLRTHGAKVKYHHDRVGGNFRLDALQAAALQVKLPHLDTWTQARQRNATTYEEAFGKRGLDGVMSLPVVSNGQHVFNQYVVRAPRRDALREHLSGLEIGTGVYYPTPLHLQPCFAHLGMRSGAFPAAEKAATEVLALPVFPGLSTEEIETVVDAIGAFYG